MFPPPAPSPPVDVDGKKWGVIMGRGWGKGLWAAAFLRVHWFWQIA
jgi:hypothetical protein